MRLQVVLLIFSLLAHFSQADESCMSRCENGFDSEKPCQCDSMCKYYKSCCSDYEDTCGGATRGDSFLLAEDDDADLDATPTPGSPTHSRPPAADSRQVKPTERPTSDFNPRRQQHPPTSMEMTQAPHPVSTETLRPPVSPTKPPTRLLRSTTEPAQTAAAAAAETTPGPTQATTEAPDPDADACSRRPFDSFMQVKNGSMYAFRGDYFFELGQMSVLPGYPKLIKDVWGISGPIDAAFTRLNCQGKTYIFKGNKYWRFDDGVLDDDYPREISVGFDRIPDHVDAAFALPAASHHGKEKVYFFKGEQYYTYEFLHQPSHSECIQMSERSPSALFRRYTGVYYNYYEPYLSELYSDLPLYHDNHHFINKDWKGLKAPIDAAMAGRMYVSPTSPWRRNNDQQWGRQQGQQYGQQNGWQWSQRRRSRSPSWGSMAEQGMNMGRDFAERGMEMGLRLAERRMEMEERLGVRWDQDWDQDRRRDSYRQNSRGNYDSRDGRYYQRAMPVQSVYFFKEDKYYRADLRTKRVDPASPPYPRSIAKYWLGCSDPTTLEK